MKPKSTGRPSAPSAAKMWPVPEESDRLLAEGACFYCGEALDQQDLAEQGQTETHEPPHLRGVPREHR